VNQNVLSNYLYFYDYSKFLYVISGKIRSLVSVYACGLPMVIAYVQPSLIFIGHYNNRTPIKRIHKHDSGIQLTELKTMNRVVTRNFL